jgi:hypothetical protein
LQIGQTLIVIGRIRIRPQNILKVVITTQNKKSTLPVKIHLCPHVPDCINKEASASFGHTLTFSSEPKIEATVGEEEEGREREREVHSWERTFCICFSYLLALYWLSILRKFLLGFLPHEGVSG